jgi:hypothetical protein
LSQEQGTTRRRKNQVMIVVYDEERATIVAVQVPVPCLGWYNNTTIIIK